MLYQFYFKKMGSSETLKDLTQKKLNDLVERFVGPASVVRITFETERSSQRVLCHLLGHNGQIYRASASSDNMYANLDTVAHKLEAQFQRVKTRGQRHRSRLSESGLRLVSNDVERDIEQDFWEDDYEPLLRHYH